MFLAFATPYPGHAALMPRFIDPAGEGQVAGLVLYAVLTVCDLHPAPACVPGTLFTLPQLLAVWLVYLVFFWDKIADLPAEFGFAVRHHNSQQTIHFKSAVKQQRKRAQQQGYRHKCARSAVARTPTTRTCSSATAPSCAGYHCFCEDHIFNHTHFTSVTFRLRPVSGGGASLLNSVQQAGGVLQNFKSSEERLIEMKTPFLGFFRSYLPSRLTGAPRAGFASARFRAEALFFRGRRFLFLPVFKCGILEKNDSESEGRRHLWTDRRGPHLHAPGGGGLWGPGLSSAAEHEPRRRGAALRAARTGAGSWGTSSAPAPDSCADALAASGPCWIESPRSRRRAGCRYVYQVALVPALSRRRTTGHTAAQRDGALCFLQFLQVLLDRGAAVLPFDSWLDFDFLYRGGAAPQRRGGGVPAVPAAASGRNISMSCCGWAGR